MVRLTKRERTERRRTEEARDLAEAETAALAAAAEVPGDETDDLDEEIGAPADDLPPAAGRCEIVIEPDAATERLDAALARRIPALSRSRLKTLIGEGRVTLDGATVTDASRKINAEIGRAHV